MTVKTVDVYLVPVGSTRYELYCESAETDELEDADPPWKRPNVYARFRLMLHEVQQARRARRLASVPADPNVRLSWSERLRNWVFGNITESIAEWRLLWHLRKQSAAVLVYPSDIEADRALSATLDILQRDCERHRRRLVISGIAAAVLGPLLFFVPGPNLVAYYFWFLAVGHLLAWRGAKHGLAVVKWQLRSSVPLVDLRHIFELEPDAREIRVRNVETRLGLDRLSVFVERMVVRFR